MPTKSIYRPQYKTLIRLLRQMRDDAGLQQEELAARLHRPQSFISNVERGRRRLDLLQLREYCTACGQDLVGFVQRFEEATDGMSRIPSV